MIPFINHVLLLFEMLFFKHARMKHPEKKFLFLAGIQMFLLLALRGETVGIDTPTYHKDVLYIVDGATVGFEVGDVWLIRIAYRLTQSVQAVIAVYAFLTILLVCVSIRRMSKDWYLSVILYEGLMYYNFAFTGMRQALAISIVMLGWTFLFRGKYFKTILCVIIAGLFHQSALVSMLCVLLDVIGKKVKIKGFVYVAMICYVPLWLYSENLVRLGTAILPEYAWYLTGYQMAGTSYMNLLFYVMILFVCACLAYSSFCGTDGRKENIRSMAILMVGVAFYVMATRFRLLNRLTMYFTIIVVFLIPSITRSLLSAKGKKMSEAACLAIVTAYFGVLVMTGSNNMVPYYFFWD